MSDSIDGSFCDAESPEKLLWAAVLIQACQDALDKDDGVDKRTAIRWFYSDEQGTGSLLWICSVLDLNPGRIREHLSDIGVRRAIGRNHIKLLKRLVQ